LREYLRDFAMCSRRQIEKFGEISLENISTPQHGLLRSASIPMNPVSSHHFFSFAFTRHRSSARLFFFSRGS